MNLIIDIGNTNIVLAIIKDETVVKKWRIATKSDNTAEDYWVSIYPFVLEEKLLFSAVAISSVVPNVTKAFHSLCEKFLKITPFFVTQENSGVDVRVKSTNVGADRLVNIIASIDKFKSKDLLIIDIGTAVTFDLVNSECVYYGGIIAPGPNIIIKAFAAATALLPPTTFTEPKKVVADSLIPAMESGVFWGYISLIDGMITKILHEENKKMFVVGTGGFIEIIAPKISSIDYYDIDLTLKGINIFLNKFL